ncbi:SRPBCC domain-containing protein [Microcella daejeonensis]|uniref:SRPBCC domain-containing protein n=1 Tax=Microcella daejeonensis TaxID=2994971 RepID=A0A9E8SBX3_9MICO|nr:SRPBCC domain-containing protein [Microcella daejeonensis]WAB81997.1 SRPBCC domain-containing protein [Microcella daejeonensis]
MTTTTRATESVESSPFRVSITTSILIDAPQAAVWSVLTDTAAYPQWNSFIRRWEGALAPGARQHVRIEPTTTSGQSFRPRIIDLQPGRELTWLGRVGLPGVLDGRHRFVVEPLGEGRSRLVQSEVLSGALVPLLRRMLTVATPAAFSRMNAELAARATAA